ncbi:hypothetical protein JCM33374_g1799 [Metschnikowia sp. JCM 33374]|nr:hypothetical protein JCM33374_g1799 [Metschnikowia sp. JCM 33374]
MHKFNTVVIQFTAFSALAFAANSPQKGTLSVVGATFFNRNSPINVIDGHLIADQGTTTFEYDENLQALKHLDSGTYLNVDEHGQLAFSEKPVPGFLLKREWYDPFRLRLKFEGRGIFELCLNDVLGFKNSCTIYPLARRVVIQFVYAHD